jgi:hypothetical protein
VRDGGGAREIGKREGAREGEQVRKGKREGKGRGRGSRSNISFDVEQPNSSACTQMQPSRGGTRSRFAYPFLFNFSYILQWLHL